MPTFFFLMEYPGINTRPPPGGFLKKMQRDRRMVDRSNVLDQQIIR